MKKYKIVCGTENNSIIDFENKINDMVKKGYIVEQFSMSVAPSGWEHYSVLMSKEE